MSPSFRASQPQQHQDTENPQQIPRSAVHDLPSADNPLWWPKAAASSFQPRPFGGRSLPKASRLPKAGSAVVTDTGRLYKYATLTSNVAAVCSDPMAIRHLDQCHAVGRSSLFIMTACSICHIPAETQILPMQSRRSLALDFVECSFILPCLVSLHGDKVGRHAPEHCNPSVVLRGMLTP
jgi:hypothetical protein